MELLFTRSAGLQISDSVCVKVYRELFLRTGESPANAGEVTVRSPGTAATDGSLTSRIRFLETQPDIRVTCDLTLFVVITPLRGVT